MNHIQTALADGTMKPERKRALDFARFIAFFMALILASGPMFAQEMPEQVSPERARANFGRPVVLAADDVRAFDAQGRFVPVAQNKINFALEGAGKIIGVGNGDPNCHEPDTFIPEVNLDIIAKPPRLEWSRSLFNGLAQIIVQSTRDAGEIKLTAAADALTLATAIMQTQPCAPRPSVP